MYHRSPSRFPTAMSHHLQAYAPTLDRCAASRSEQQDQTDRDVKAPLAATSCRRCRHSHGHPRLEQHAQVPESLLLLSARRERVPPHSKPVIRFQTCQTPSKTSFGLLREYAGLPLRNVSWHPAFPELPRFARAGLHSEVMRRNL